MLGSNRCCMIFDRCGITCYKSFWYFLLLGYNSGYIMMMQATFEVTSSSLEFLYVILSIYLFFYDI